MADQDQIEGTVKKIKGKLKENLGWVTDDRKAEHEGRAEKIEGQIQEETGEEIDTSNTARGRRTRPAGGVY